jgi:type II secretory pathway component PulK
MKDRRRCGLRRAFALLAVLWVMTGVAMLALGVALIARDGVAAAQNRVDLARAAWHAEECLARARVIAHYALSRQDESVDDTPAWLTLDRTVHVSLASHDRCDVELRAAGSAIDMATVDEAVLHALLEALGRSGGRADSMTHAFLDWRDADGAARPLGAERSWYESQHRSLPRDSAPAHVREIARIRGWEELGGVDTLFTAEPGRIALNHAPLLVLSALPGFSEEAVSRVAERRLRGEPVLNLIALAGELSPAAREAMSRRYADLSRLTTTEPDAWIVTSRARSGARGVAVTIELRLARAGRRTAIVTRRSWMD